MADFDEAIRRDPKFGEAYRERGNAVAAPRRQGQGPGRFGPVAPARLRRLPGPVLPRQRPRARGELEAALADYGAALKLDPTFARAYFQRALVYVARQQMATALADYRQVVRLAPRSPEVYKGWGRAEDKDSRGRAVDQLEALLEQAKDEARGHSQQGTAFHKAGDFDKAVAEYDKALELYPRYTEIYYNRGLAYRQKGDLDRAIGDYTHALRSTRSTSPPIPTGAMPTL